MKITNNEIIVEFPEEEIATIHTYHWVSGFNNAIDKTERLNPPLVVDVEALAKIIFHDRYPVYKWEDASLIDNVCIWHFGKSIPHGAVG